VAGREQERLRVESFIDTIGSGATTLLLVGEPGIGKSTLWAHGVAHARAAGLHVLISRPTEDEFRYPAAGLADLFDGVEGRDRIGSMAGPVTAADTEPAERGRRVLEALRALAGTHPVLLAVDDIPWLDTVSGRALRFALNRVAPEPIGLLATAPAATPSVGGRDTEVLELGPLPVQALRRVLAASVASITAPELMRAHELTGGNPMLATELVRSWQRGGPDALNMAPFHALAERVSELPADAATVARVLAIAGPSSAGVIDRASAVGDFPAAVRSAVEAGIVRIEDDFVMRFTHSLYASAVTAVTTALDRRVIHARLAEEVADPDVRARHLAHATVNPDPAVADLVEAAALRCAQRGAFDLAARLAGQSARLTPAGSPDRVARRALLDASYRAVSGDTARALERVDHLLATLQPGPARAEALTARVFLHFGDSERFLTEALQDAGTDEALRARALDLLGWQVGIYQGRLAEGLAHATAALDLARRLDGATETEMCAETTVSTCSVLMGRPQEELITHALLLSTRCRVSPLGRWPPVFRARQLLWAGHLDEARLLFEQMRRRAAGLGSEFQRPYRLYELALVEIAAGDLAGALRLAEEALDAARDAGSAQAAAWVSYAFGLASALQGADEQASWAADQITDWSATTDEAPRTAMAQEVLGTLAASHGDWPRALGHFEKALAVLDRLQYAHPGARPALPRAIEAAATTGDRTRCATLTDRLAEQARTLTAPWVDAQLQLACGQLSLLGADTDTAVRRIGDAVRSLDGLGFRVDAARARLALARAELRAGKRSEARRTAELARTAFAVAPAPPWAAAADDLVLRAGGRPAGEGLTATEERIVAMITTGQTNREIASRLFVAESTVEAHLTRIYRKVGVHGRTALARWVHDRQ
jgi:DNA-binding CsgD family transcriptional regulator/tetratricopeptide (TPR) repeat protein